MTPFPSSDAPTYVCHDRAWYGAPTTNPIAPRIPGATDERNATQKATVGCLSVAPNSTGGFRNPAREGLAETRFRAACPFGDEANLEVGLSQ
jgi:hypothetical protein